MTLELVEQVYGDDSNYTASDVGTWFEFTAASEINWWRDYGSQENPEWPAARFPILAVIAGPGSFTIGPNLLLVWAVLVLVVLVLAHGEAGLAKVDVVPLLIIEMAGVWAYVFHAVVEFRDHEGRLLGRFQEVLGVQPTNMGTDGQRLFLTSGFRSSLPPVGIGPIDSLLTPIRLEEFQTWEEACAAVNVANGNVPYTLPFPSTRSGVP